MLWCRLRDSSTRHHCLAQKGQIRIATECDGQARDSYRDVYDIRKDTTTEESGDGIESCKSYEAPVHGTNNNETHSQKMEPLVEHPASYGEKVMRWLRGTTGATMTRQPLILLLSGWAGSGKDAAAALLAEELGFARYSFAAALKDDASAETGIPLTDFQELHTKDAALSEPCYAFPRAKTPREVLLEYAARIRGYDPDVYARTMVQGIEREDVTRIVVSDWRLKSERDYIVKHLPQMRVITVRITRTGVTPRAEAIEHELDEFPFDLRIQNDGCISDLRDALRSVLRPYLSATGCL
jgi:hypothetical protein